MSFIIIVLVLLVFMYLLLIRPQRRQQRRHGEMLASLKVGDEVITAGGIYGDVTGLEDDKVHLLIAEDVEIEVARRSIATVIPEAAQEEGFEEEEQEEEEEEEEEEPEEGSRVEPEGEAETEPIADDGARRPS